MSVELWVGKRKYESNKRFHAEEEMINSGRHKIGNFTAEMNAWPCCETERFHNCHNKLKAFSANRIITLNITGDTGGYALNHKRPLRSTGRIIYNDGTATTIVV